MNDIWMIVLLVLAILISSVFIILSLWKYRVLKGKDFIFNFILALAIDIGSLYFLLSDRWCYTCSVYNNYLLYGGFVVISIWMVYDLIKDLRQLDKVNNEN